MSEQAVHEFLELASRIASKQASYLLTNQVIQDDISLDFNEQNVSRFSLTFFRNSVPLDLSAKVNNDKIEIRCSDKKSIVSMDDFFRIDLHGNIHYIEGFKGLAASNKLFSPPPFRQTTESHPLTFKTRAKKSLKSLIKSNYHTAKLARSIKSLLMRREKPNDLSHFGGITFRAVREGYRSYRLECYDFGGIYDPNLNAEGIFYPAQVAGNYYADGYSTLVFLHMYEHTQDKVWFEAAVSSWRFLKRIYPRYLPAHIVWHHSDFKNAAILEIINEYSKKFEEFSEFPSELVEDYYEPTNVYALRCHWKYLAKKLRVKHQFQDPTHDLERVAEDQTLDGLIHDNIDTYPDAHDLTYHQYSCACLAGALSANHSKDMEAVFLKAVKFTLEVMGSDGETAYVGRASNNLHHAASSIYAFAKAAELENALNVKASFIKGAILCLRRLSTFQDSHGHIPTGLNDQAPLRMAWNHCSSTYNALSCFFLHEACKLVGSNTSLLTSEKATIPMQTNRAWVGDDAGYACLSNRLIYAVIFSGCDKSYPWSEGKHITGAAGIALLGNQGQVSIFPCIDLHKESNTLVSDLPVINGLMPFGRGSLELITSRYELPGIKLTHHYGFDTNVELVRIYFLEDNTLIIRTKVQVENTQLNDISVKVPFLHENNKKIEIIEAENAAVIGDQLKITADEHYFDIKRYKVSRNKLSNAKGFIKIFELPLMETSNKTDLSFDFRVELL